MAKDTVVPEMRERLVTNRSGKLTTTQWTDMIMQPIISLLVLLAPVTAFILPRMLAMIFRGGWFILLVLVLVVVLTTISRAYRYARAPIYFEEMRAAGEPPPFWMFWRALTLYDQEGRPVKFASRLAPRPILERDKIYIVYYLKDDGGNVLLSIAPAGHPDAEKWQPDNLFEARFSRRKGKTS